MDIVDDEGGGKGGEDDRPRPSYNNILNNERGGEN
jgi:hypothetical protein